MKYTLLILAASVALATDPPKPKPLPDADKLKLVTAQKAILQLDNAQKQLQLQYAANEKALQAAQAELATTYSAVVKAHGCASISEELQCVPAPKVEAKTEAKPEKK